MSTNSNLEDKIGGVIMIIILAGVFFAIFVLPFINLFNSKSSSGNTDTYNGRDLTPKQEAEVYEWEQEQQRKEDEYMRQQAEDSYQDYLEDLKHMEEYGY